MAELNEAQRTQIREAFSLFMQTEDALARSPSASTLSTQSPEMGEKDLIVALQALGFPPKEGEARRIIETYTGSRENGGGGLTVEEFEDVMAAKLAEDVDDAFLQHGFDLLDENRSGALTLDALQRLAAEMGEDISDEQLALMITQAQAAAHQSSGDYASAARGVDKDAFFAISR